MVPASWLQPKVHVRPCTGSSQQLIFPSTQPTPRVAQGGRRGAPKATSADDLPPEEEKMVWEKIAWEPSYRRRPRGFVSHCIKPIDTAALAPNPTFPGGRPRRSLGKCLVKAVNGSSILDLRIYVSGKYPQNIQPTFFTLHSGCITNKQGKRLRRGQELRSR